jgi:N-acetylmuramoyl-L-alanine amidase
MAYGYAVRHARRFASWMLGLCCAAGMAHASTALERVEVIGTPVVAVRVYLAAPVTATAHTLPADGDRPERVYLDLPGATLDGTVPAAVAGVEPLLRVRTGQFDPSTVRVVLDLARPVPFVLRQTDTSITVELAVPPSPPPIATPVPRREPTPVARPFVPAPPPRRPTAERARIVVLDAGHGGHDPGAMGLAGLTEKTITLDLARRVAERLAGHVAIEVLLTRNDDSFVAIDERIARAADAALFVSLHANAAADATLSGVEVFYGGGGVDAPESGPRSPVRLGLDVVEAIERHLGDIRTIVRPGRFGVLARNAVPSVLVEIGYLTNATDAVRLQDEAYRTRVAQAIADGAAAFLQEPMSLAAR